MLIVDNDFTVASNLNKQLNKMGYEVCGVAETSEETALKINQFRPDLILMNLNLNEKENRKNIEPYLDIYIKDNIPVVFLSNKIDKALLKKTRIINNSTFITKPVNSKELRTTIGLLLKSSGQQTDENLKSEENKELQRLNALNRYEIIDSPSDNCFDRITLITARFFNVPVAVITLVDKTKIWFKSPQGLILDYIERTNIDNHSILPLNSFFENRGQNKKKFIADFFSPSDKSYCFYAAAPLITPEGHILGTLSIMDKESRTINKSSEKILTDLAAIVMDEFELRLTSKMAVKFQHELINIATTFQNEKMAGVERLKNNSSIDNEIKIPAGKISSMIKDSSKQTDQIIEELFHSAIINSGKIILQTEPVNLTEIALEVIKTYRKIASKKGQVLKLFIESNPVVEGDRIRLKEVMGNLIDNAIKYSERDTIIDVNVIAGEGKAYFEVKDQGQGLTEEDKAILFTNIVRSGERHSEKELSIGIGLSIVKTIVEMHGGIVRAESEGKDMGSSFIVELPKIN